MKVTQACPTLGPYGLQPTRLLCPWDSPGQDTGVGCHALLQGSVPGSEPGSTALQMDSLSSESPGKPKYDRGSLLKYVDIINVDLSIEYISICINMG